MDETLIKTLIQNGRDFMKMPIEDPTWRSDQDQKKTQPPLVKAPMRDQAIDLPLNFETLSIGSDFLHILNTRKSDRVYTLEPVSLTELSYLLWTCQGIKEIKGNHYATIRTVPCGGARHQFETYLALQKIEGLKDGLYHYLPMTHQVELLKEMTDQSEFITKAVGGQAWASKANINLFLSVVPYRCEWRYGIYAHRVALIDAGHISQNLYLAATSIGLGGCGVGYIDQAILDQAFELDGNQEFIFYAFPIGTCAQTSVYKDPYALIRQNRQK